MMLTALFLAPAQIVPALEIDLKGNAPVGEFTRERQTVEFVSELFRRPPLSRFDPEEGVGIGAAAHASILESC